MKPAVWWDQMNRGRDEKTDNSNAMVEVIIIIKKINKFPHDHVIFSLLSA